MQRTLLTIGLILFGTYPVGLSAQVVSTDTPTSTAAAAAWEAESSMPLKQHAPTDRQDTEKPTDGLQTLVTVGGSLAVVLGVFFLIVWLLRRASPGGTGTLPGEVFEVLGRAPLTHHQQVQLVRCGDKLLLVAVGAAGAGPSASTLTEITDPNQVDRLTGLCRQTRGGSSSKTFRQVLRQVGGRS